MEQKNAARERLAQLENKYFQGISLTETALMKTEEERRPFVLAQVERLLNTGRNYCPLAMSLSDEFWTASEGRTPMYDDDPLEADDLLEVLTHEEIMRTALILDIAGLCHDLSLHYVFDQHEAFGIKGQFWVSNKELVEWLKTTPYEHIAMHTAYILKRHASDVYFDMHYQPAQDATAEIFSSEYRELIREPRHTEMPPRAYVETILDTLQRIERHWQRGRRLKLNPEVVKLHDDIYGVVPLQFDRVVLEAAQAIYDYMEENVRGRLHYSGRFVSWDKLPKSYRNKCDGVMRRFIQRVREVRAQYLAEGWVADDSLEFAYLMAHAQNCGYGIWREEDEAL